MIELEVLAKALDSGCSACEKALQLSNCLSPGWVVFCISCAAIWNVER